MGFNSATERDRLRDIYLLKGPFSGVNESDMINHPPLRRQLLFTMLTFYTTLIFMLEPMPFHLGPPTSEAANVTSVIGVRRVDLGFMIGQCPTVGKGLAALFTPTQRRRLGGVAMRLSNM